MYDIDEFVNGNRANVSNITEQQFLENIVYTEIDESAFPVSVYVRDGHMIAWYDYELEQGFVA